MGRTKGGGEIRTISIILIALAIGLTISCTQSLFMVKGTRNQVNQKSENNTEVSVDSTNIKTELQ